MHSRVQNRPRKRRSTQNTSKSREPTQRDESPSILESLDLVTPAAPLRDVDNDSCIVIESDDDDIEITGSNCLDDSVICLGPAALPSSYSFSDSLEVLNCPGSIPTYSPSEGIEVISENIGHQGSHFQQPLSNVLPPVFIVDQSSATLEPTSVSTQVVRTSSRVDPYSCEKDSASNANSKSNSDSIIKCPICLDDSKTIQQSERQLVVTTCGHIYCNDCLETVLRMNKQCSKCRKRLSKKQYHPLYL